MQRVSKVQYEKKDQSKRIAHVVFMDPTEQEFDSNSMEPCRCSTIGIVDNLDDRFLRVTWILYEGEPNSGYGLVLPKGCVVSIKNLE